MIKFATALLMSFLFVYPLFGQERVYSADKKISIVPIESWKNHSKDNDLIFAQANENRFDRYRENILVQAHPAYGRSLNELWNLYIVEDFPYVFDDYQMIQSDDTTIDGKPVKWIEFTYTDKEKLKFRILIYMLVEDDVMYQLICSAMEDAFPKTEKLFKKMVESFEIE